jgi:hypothetical protein
MAHKPKGKKSGKAKKPASRATSPRPSAPAKPTIVNLRFHNEGTMAASKTGHAKPGEHKPRRRRKKNPSFGEAVLKVLGGVAAATGVAIAEIVVISKWDHPVVAYGLPAVVTLGGMGIATKYPTVGLGVAAGAVAPVVGLPVAAALLGATQTQKGAAALRGAAWREYPRLSAVQMGAVRMGAVRMGRAA